MVNKKEEIVRYVTVLALVLAVFCCGCQKNTELVSDKSASFVEVFGKLSGVTDSTLSALQAHLEKGEEMEAPDSAWMAENVRLMRLMALEHRISLGEAMLNDTTDEAKRAQIQEKLKELREEEKRLNQR
ncbi:MAG: hypothetical protein KAU91_09160 [Candidatus Aminicenantes bacterium]|nr:hypothetical protein [Candidatus Aminicenantes bacterium]